MDRPDADTKLGGDSLPAKALGAERSKINSLWASKTGNAECAESVTCDPGRSGVFGQPR